MGEDLFSKLMNLSRQVMNFNFKVISKIQKPPDLLII